MDCENLLNAAEYLFKHSKMFAVVTDNKLKCLWANEIALKRFPTLALPDGLLDLVKSTNTEALIKSLANSNPYNTYINYEPFNKLNATFIPILDKNEFCGCVVTMKSLDYNPVCTDTESTENVLAAFSNGYRMPLTIIFSTLGLIARRLDGNTDETIKNYLRLITQNCYRILRLSNNLSEISRYRSGNGEINARNGNICRFLNGLCSAASIMTLSVDIPLETEIPDRDIILSFDPAKLSTALLNVISNSCKYTRKGNIIKVKLKILEQQVVISISDTGQGIKADQLKYIFTPYFTYDPDGKQFSGIGLGLSLAKYIIALHAGTVAVQSKEGEGTTVAFSLPIHCDENLPDYTAENGADYLADRFSPLYVELSDVCRCPLP